MPLRLIIRTAAAAAAAGTLAVAWLAAAPLSVSAQPPSVTLLVGAPVNYQTVQGVAEGNLVVLQYQVTLSAAAPAGGWRGTIRFGRNCGGETTTASVSDYSITGFEGSETETRVLIASGETVGLTSQFNFMATADSAVSEADEQVMICLYGPRGRFQAAAKVVITERECYEWERRRPGGGCVNREGSDLNFTVERPALYEDMKTLITVTPVLPLTEYPIRCNWSGDTTGTKAVYGTDYTVDTCGTRMVLEARQDNNFTETGLEYVSLTISQGRNSRGKTNIVSINPAQRNDRIAGCVPSADGYVGSEMTVGLSGRLVNTRDAITVAGSDERNAPRYARSDIVYDRTTSSAQPVSQWRLTPRSAARPWGWPSPSDPTLNPNNHYSGKRFSNYIWIRDHNGLNKGFKETQSRRYPKDLNSYLEAEPSSPPQVLPGARYWWDYHREIKIKTPYRSTQRTIKDEWGTEEAKVRWTPASGGHFSFQEGQGGEWNTCRFRIYDTLVTLTPTRVSENSGATSVTIAVSLLEETLPTASTTVNFAFRPGTASTRDYSLAYQGNIGTSISGSVVVPGGRRRAFTTVTFTPVDDHWHEPGWEYVAFDVNSPGRLAYTNHRLNIRDNDAPPRLTGVTVSGTLAEPPLGVASWSRTLTFTAAVGSGRYENRPNVYVMLSSNPADGGAVINQTRTENRSNSWTHFGDDVPQGVYCFWNLGRKTGTFFYDTKRSAFVKNPGRRLTPEDDIQVHRGLRVLRASPDRSDITFPHRPSNMCTKYAGGQENYVFRGSAGAGAGNVVLTVPMRVVGDYLAECAEDAVFTLWLASHPYSIAPVGDAHKVRVRIEDTSCVSVEMTNEPHVTEGETANLAFSITGGRRDTSFRVEAISCGSDVRGNERGESIVCGNQNLYRGVKLHFPYRNPHVWCPSDDGWDPCIRPPHYRCTKDANFSHSLEIGDDSDVQGEDRYILIYLYYDYSYEARASYRCRAPNPVPKFSRWSHIVGRVRISDNDARTTLHHTHVTDENGDDPAVWDTRYFKIRPDDHDSSLRMNGYNRNGGPTIDEAASSGMFDSDNPGDGGIWRVNRWTEEGVYLDISGDTAGGDVKAVFSLLPRPWSADYNGYNRRTLLDEPSRTVTITIEDDDATWPAWGASCSRHFGEGLAATWTSPSYAGAGGEHNLYQLAATSWKTPVLWAGTATDAEGDGWARSATYDDGGTSRGAAVTATATHLDLAVNPAPAGGLVLRLVSAGGKVVTADTASAASRPGGGWRWPVGDLFPAGEGSLWEAGDVWAVSLFEGGGPGGLAPTVSGTGSAAAVALAGTPAGQGSWRMSVRPYDADGPLVQAGGAAVEMICSHNVELPAWDPSLLGDEWGGVCEVRGTAVRSGVRLHPTSSPPSYPYPSAGYAPRPVNVRWSPDPRAAPRQNAPAGNARWGMTASASGWAGNAARQLAAHLTWRMEDGDGNILRGRDASGALTDVSLPCALRIAAPALGGGACSALTGVGAVLSHRVLDYGSYPGSWNARFSWSPIVPPGVRLVRIGDVLTWAGSVPDPGVWEANVRLTDPGGVPLSRRGADGGWAEVGSSCGLRAVNLNGATPPDGASRPAVRVGPSCAPPGDSWEVRLRKAGEAGTPETLWRGFVPPGITDPARLIFWYPYPATLRGGWLAPWEKPLPGPGEAHYPEEGEFNDPFRRSGESTWTASRYRRLMREAWEEYFPEYPLTP